MNSLYFYENYRDFLKDFYHFKKKSDSSFSYKRLAQLMGVKAPSYLKMVIDGQRNLSQEKIFTVARGLSLNTFEVEFFEVLVSYTHSITKEEKAFYFDKMVRLRSNKSQEIKKFSSEEVKILSQWYYAAFWIYCDGKREGPELIEALKKVFVLDNNEVFATLDYLKINGFLTLEKGVLQMNGKSLTLIDQKKWNQAYRIYLHEQLKLSEQKMLHDYDKGPTFFSHTFTCGKDQFSYYKDSIQKFLDELSLESNRESPEKIAQINLQYFSYN